MSDPATQLAEEDWAWRLVKKKDSSNATLELGEMYADAPDVIINRLIHVIGESLIKAGMQMIQSQLVDEDGYDDDE